jgi:hypothetical protein
MDTYENEEIILQTQAPAETETAETTVEQTEDFEIEIYDDDAAEQTVETPVSAPKAQKQRAKRVTVAALMLAMLFSSAISALLVSFYFEKKLTDSNQLTQYYLDSMNNSWRLCSSRSRIIPLPATEIPCPAHPIRPLTVA